MTDRVLDEAPRERRQADARSHLERRSPEVHAPRCTGRGREHDDGVVPEVDRVGAHAEPAQRPPGEQARELGRRMRGHSDDRGGEHRQQQHPAPVEEGLVLVGLPEHDEHPEQCQPPDAVEEQPSARHHPLLQAPARPDHRERRPDEQGEGPRVRPVVDPGRISSRDVEDRHLHRRCEREDEGEPEEAAPAQVAQPQPEQQRPDEVELFLHRERPEVPERRGWPEASEVGDVVEDEPPVAHVQARRQHVTTERGQLAAIEDRHPRRDDHQHHRERRQEPPRAVDPEGSQAEPPRALVAREQQVGDEVAGQDEEHAHPEQPAARPAEAEVEGDDREHRDRT